MELHCIVYDKLLKPRQSFRITLCVYIYITQRNIPHFSRHSDDDVQHREVICILCILRVLEVWREDDLTEVACVKIGTR